MERELYPLPGNIQPMSIESNVQYSIFAHQGRRSHASSSRYSLNHVLLPCRFHFLWAHFELPQLQSLEFMLLYKCSPETRVEPLLSATIVPLVSVITPCSSLRDSTGHFIPVRPAPFSLVRSCLFPFRPDKGNKHRNHHHLRRSFSLGNSYLWLTRFQRPAVE